MLRCSAPVLRSGACTKSSQVHMCFYIHLDQFCLLHSAPLLSTAEILHSDAPILPRICSTPSLPLRCSDAPLRSAALVLTFCAPMLRCWDALAQLTCSEAPHSSRALLPLLSLPVPKLHTPPVLYTASWPLSGGNTFSAPVLVSARGLCAPALFYDSPLAAFAPLRCWCLRPLRPCSHARGLCALALVLAAFAPLHGSG